MATMKINIPPRFLDVMKNTTWDAAVQTVANNIQPFIDRTPIFFPEYTIHGVDHVNHVLEIADKLIPINTMEHLSEKDIGVLTCAILLHDLVMFVDNTKFVTLINIDAYIPGFKPDEKNIELWNDYCRKARKNAPSNWYNLVGVSKHSIPVIDDSGSWTERDKMIIGEFLRWYHHRFAHDIALNGFMGQQMLPDFISNREKDVIGIIARSHGMDIRSNEIEDYFLELAGGYDYVDNSPVYYLMALLRLSDYLDAGVERAPKAVSDTHVFSSVTSRNEWILNQCFKYESFGWNDAAEKRALAIPATPTTTSEFVCVEKMLLSIQREFDSSVAIIEELYRGKYNLNVNRVTSNVLIAKSKTALAKRFVLNDTRLAASSDIIPLLVSPLYANSPTFGVRELIQNAVDACRERETKEIGSITKILIDVDTVQKKFVIADNGIGMDEDIIRNYYLKAGSSYRKSASYVDNYIDDNGKAQFARIGCFGVGALASFLLGDKITISTRRLGSKTGYIFTYGMDFDTIDVSCNDSIPVGTVVSIDMSDNACLYFNCEYYLDYNWTTWYRLATPKMEIYCNGKPLVNKWILPEKANAKDGWFDFDSKKYENFVWSYDCINPTTNESIPEGLICNGIPVAEFKSPYGETQDPIRIHSASVIYNGGFDIHLPLISLTDKDGLIETDLSRCQIKRFPFEKDFINEIYKYLIAELLTDEQFNDIKQNGASGWESKHGYIPIAKSKKGYTILARSFILHTGVSVWCYIGANAEFNDNDIPFGYFTHKSIHSGYGHFGNNISTATSTYINGDLMIESNHCKDCVSLALYNGKHAKTKLFILTNNSRKLCETFSGEFSDDIYYILPDGADIGKNQEEEILKLASFLKEDNSIFIKYTPTPIRAEEKNLMLDMLQKYIPANSNGGWIPYDLNERKRLYPEAFTELEPYISSINNNL